VLALIITIVAVIISGVSALIGYLAHRANRSRDTKIESDDYLAKQIKLALTPIDVKFTGVTALLTGIQMTLDTQKEGLGRVSSRQGDLLDRTSVLETKVAVFWKNVAMDAATILHSPDPRRKPVDLLLEAFMAGTINTEQIARLRQYLKIIMMWEPGQPWPSNSVPEFPIRDGEQSSAMMLLRSMDHVGKRGPTK
jgi:hypothetical protein